MKMNAPSLEIGSLNAQPKAWFGHFAYYKLHSAIWNLCSYPFFNITFIIIVNFVITYVLLQMISNKAPTTSEEEKNNYDDGS
mmetsp:Transcript_8965/g.10767  ORF Transcript_8965/g.10767 Transcript_8965/m.10767 type:complete len:82 (-) Transcript_8965:1253-1498(-)